MTNGLTGSEIEALVNEFNEQCNRDFKYSPHSINSMKNWAKSNYPPDLNEYTKALNDAVPLLWKHYLNGLQYEKGDYSLVYKKGKDY